MKRLIPASLILSVIFPLLTLGDAFAQNNVENSYERVVEESYYVVKPENKEKFLKIYRERVYPFWKEMEKMGLIVGGYKLYSHRIHTLTPKWTFKTVTAFKNYEAIDKWLEVKFEVYNRLFPGEGGYASARAEIDKIVEEHWDEFLREIPLEEKN